MAGCDTRRSRRAQSAAVSSSAVVTEPTSLGTSDGVPESSESPPCACTSGAGFQLGKQHSPSVSRRRQVSVYINDCVPASFEHSNSKSLRAAVGRIPSSVALLQDASDGVGFYPACRVPKRGGRHSRDEPDKWLGRGPF